jgi:hypothetical protein
MTFGVSDSTHQVKFKALAFAHCPPPQNPPEPGTLSFRFHSVRLAVEWEIRAVDVTVPLTDERSMEEVIGRTIARETFTMTLLSTFATIALVLAGWPERPRHEAAQGCACFCS